MFLSLNMFVRVLDYPVFGLSVPWCSCTAICRGVLYRRKMAVTRRAWESVNLIRWSQADVPTGVRGQHQTSGLGGDYLAGERRVACGDLLEGMSPAQRGPQLPISSWCDCVAVVNSKSVPKLFPALDTFPLYSGLCNTFCQVVTFLQPLRPLIMRLALVKSRCDTSRGMKNT